MQYKHKLILRLWWRLLLLSGCYLLFEGNFISGQELSDGFARQSIREARTIICSPLNQDAEYVTIGRKDGAATPSGPSRLVNQNNIVCQTQRSQVALRGYGSPSLQGEPCKATGTPSFRFCVPPKRRNVTCLLNFRSANGLLISLHTPTSD